MAERIKALVEPVLLIWARETAAVGIDEAAKAAGVDAEKLRAWETGSDAPTVGQLRKLAEKYRRPLSLFYLSEPPRDFSTLRDYRRLPEATERRYSARLAYEVRAAQERRLIALDLFDALGEAPESLGVMAQTLDDPEDIGRQLRARLGVTLEQQGRWNGDAAKAFKAWREAMESAGVLVFVLSGAHHRVPIEEVRGFAIAERPLPAVVVNGGDRGNGRVFTLLHELAHVVIGQSAIENETEPGETMPPPDRAVEVFCNRVAAAVLMPRDALLGESIVERQKARTSWSEVDIVALARRYGVSREALLVRLVELGRIDRAFYQAKRQEYARQYGHVVQESEEEGGGRFVPIRHQVLGHLGRSFTRLVLQAYYNNRLTLSAVSGYLGVQAKTVPGIEQAAFARTG